MDGDQALPYLRESKGEWDCIRMVVAPVELKRDPTLAQVEDLAKSTVVVQHRGKLARPGHVQPSPQEAIPEGFVMRLGSNCGLCQTHPVPRVCIHANQ